MRIIKKILFTVLMMLLFGCPDIQTFSTRYMIVNETDHQVQLRFYKAIITTEERSFEFKVEIEGEGLILERILDTDALTGNGPTVAYESDSVAVIFNNERIEGHILTVPVSGSIMNISGYQSNEAGNDYLYTITNTNYNNATPCDGPCN
jgi:hypothetical protein